MNSLFTVIFSAIILSCTASQLPSYFQKCSAKDPNLVKCIERSANLALPTFIKGDKAIHVVKLNPLYVQNMYIDVNGGLQINLTDFNIWGLETAKIVFKDWNQEIKHVETEVSIDNTGLIGTYNISGQILILPITGTGPCNITLVNPIFKYFFDFEMEDRSGKEYIKITNTGLTYETERAYFKLLNLFNGNKQLGEAMLKFLDENWKDVNAEIGARVGDALALVFSNILQNMFYKIPFNELFDV